VTLEPLGQVGKHCGVRGGHSRTGGYGTQSPVFGFGTEKIYDHRWAIVNAGDGPDDGAGGGAGWVTTDTSWQTVGVRGRSGEGEGLVF